MTSITPDSIARAITLARRLSAEVDATDLADHVGYSPFHFSRLFTRSVGIGPGQYLIALRIDAAKRLLLTGDEAVIDVATAVGFDSLSSFTRRFGATVGVSPGRLRRLPDRLADQALQPFSLPAPGPGSVHVDLELPVGFSPRGDASIWVGWFPRPAPIGLPWSGTLVTGGGSITLPLRQGAPYLLAFAVPAHAEPLDQLVPEVPMVAVHPVPVTRPARLTLHFAVSDAHRPPLLAALPSLLPPR